MPLRISWIRSDDKGYLSGLPGGAEQTVGVVARYFSLGDVAPNFYPVAIGVWRSVMLCWAVVAVRGAEPSAERSAADRRAVA
jgi:hypothetical protein